MPGRLDFQFPLGKPSGAAPRRRETEAMRLLLVGDFGGSSRPALAQRATLRVDIERLDDVLQRVAPRVTLAVGGESCEFAPVSLDDFHPDRLLELLPPLSRALDLRARLAQPALFARAAAELGLTTDAPTPAPPAGDNGDLLGRLLRGGSAGAAVATTSSTTPTAIPAATAGAGIDALIRRIVAPHVVPGAPPQQAAYVAAADAALAEQLRSVLQAPAFRALEAAWRGVHWLVGQLELDESLQLHLFDATREELLADVVAAQGRSEQTGLHAALVDPGRGQHGGQRWAALVGLLEFGPGDIDIGLLAALGRFASLAGGPWLAGGAPALAAGDGSPGWQALRASEVAPWIGLVAPRPMLRLPYGKGYERVEAFAFEEIVGRATPEAFVWGGAALSAALLLGQAYSRAGGWSLALEAAREIADLPAYTLVRDDGERELQACAEHYLSDAQAEQWLAAGLMPLASHRQRNAALLLRWQSVARPPRALAGLQAAA
jgi:hypothetical protein